MNKDFYISLIAKQLSNELNAAQLKDLSSWLSSSKDNAGIADDLKSVWNLSQNYKQDVSFNVDAAFSKFTQTYNIPQSQSTITAQKPSRTARIAFLIIAILGLFSLAYFMGLFNSSKISNDNMRALTVQLDPMSSITLAPEASYSEGEAEKLNAKQLQAFIAIQDAVNESRFNSTDHQYNKDHFLPIDAGFVPSSKNYAAKDFLGQGYFDLKSLNDNQVLVGLKGGLTLGTTDASFNVQNYDGDNQLTIDVQSGKLVFYDKSKNAYIVAEGQRAIFDKDAQTLVKANQPKLNPFKWHKGILVFDNTPLDEVFEKIERFYGVDVDVVDDSSLENKNFTATLSMSSNLNDCLDLLHGSYEMTIRRKGLRTIEISDVKGF